MNSQADDTSGSGPADPPIADAPLSPWAALVALVADVRDSIRGRVHLFSLELKRAGVALGQIVALGLLAAFMAHAAWFAFVIGLGWTAIALGAPWWTVMIAVVALHLGIAAWAVLRLMKLTRLVGMPATMRHLMGKSHQPAVVPGAPVVTPASAVRETQ